MTSTITGPRARAPATTARYRETVPPLIWDRRPDALRAPALVCAFKGWNDAADSASTAVGFVGSALEGSRFASIDPEAFFDFQAPRPPIPLPEGRSCETIWPETAL